MFKLRNRRSVWVIATVIVAMVAGASPALAHPWHGHGGRGNHGGNHGGHGNHGGTHGNGQHEDDQDALHLLSVSFYTPVIADFTQSNIDTVNDSPYTGVAIPLINQFDDQQHTVGEFLRASHRIDKTLNKELYPWIYLNRMLGHNPPDVGAAQGDTPYFRAINGMDIYDQAGALTDFKQLFRAALLVARTSHSPGMLLDPEYSNNRAAGRIDDLAQKYGKTDDQIIQRLEEIGADLADITAATYPDAIIWLTWSRLNSKFVTQTARYIVQGMIQRAIDRNIPMRVVSGGETSVHYCHLSLADLQDTLDSRADLYAPVLEQYSPVFTLGGTIAPWADASQRTGFLDDTTGGYRKCGLSTLQTADDFVPLLRTLFNTYQYMWIYAAMAAPYNPYDHDPDSPAYAAPYNHALEEALSES